MEQAALDIDSATADKLDAIDALRGHGLEIAVRRRRLTVSGTSAASGALSVTGGAGDLSLFSNDGADFIRLQSNGCDPYIRTE